MAEAGSSQKLQTPTTIPQVEKKKTQNIAGST